MIGLALMAMNLAEERLKDSGTLAPNFFGNKAPVSPRSRDDLWMYPISQEYYAICSRIEAGEKP
jgi:hypothetical protein